MAIYCGSCAAKKKYPRSSIRSGGRAACQFCGEIDAIPVRNVRTGETEMKQIGNYSYPDDLLPDSPNEVNNVRAREQQGGSTPQTRGMR